MNVFQIYYEFVLERFSEISDETWDILLRSILGLVDYTLVEVNDPNIKKFSARILKLFFEIWLYSGTINAEHYAHFHKLCLNWLDQEEFIKMWSSVTLGLTKKLISIIY